MDGLSPRTTQWTPAATKQNKMKISKRNPLFLAGGLSKGTLCEPEGVGGNPPCPVSFPLLALPWGRPQSQSCTAAVVQAPRCWARKRALGSREFAGESLLFFSLVYLATMPQGQSQICGTAWHCRKKFWGNPELLNNRLEIGDPRNQKASGKYWRGENGKRGSPNLCINWHKSQVTHSQIKPKGA